MAGEGEQAKGNIIMQSNVKGTETWDLLKGLLMPHTLDNH